MALDHVFISSFWITKFEVGEGSLFLAHGKFDLLDKNKPHFKWNILTVFNINKLF